MIDKKRFREVKDKSHWDLSDPTVIQLTTSTGQDVCLVPPLFHCLGAQLVLLLHGFVAK